MLPTAVAAALAASLSSGAPLISTSTRGVGGYGGPWVKMTGFAGAPALLGGGPLAVVRFTAHTGAGVTLTVSEGDVEGLSIQYLGLFGELTFGELFGFIEPAVGVTIGAGQVLDDRAAGARDRAAVLVVEPQLAVAFEFLRSNRLAVVGGYRWVPFAGALPGRSAADWGGPVAGLQLQEGVFHPDLPPPEVELSGFFGTRISALGGRGVHFDGGGTRLLFHRRWGFGLSGYVVRDWFAGAPAPISGGYAGGIVERHFFDDTDAHPFLALLAGVGGFARPGDAEPSFQIILEPTLGIELGLTSFVRLGLGLSYRFAASPSPLPTFDTFGASAPSLLVDLRFGHF